MRRFTRLVMVLLMVVACVASAARADDPSVFVVERHGYTLKLPASWSALPRRTGGDVADVRFGGAGFSLRGSYQVYEDAATDDPTLWYQQAKAGYQRAADTMSNLEKMQFSSLEKARLGGRAAWAFGFVCTFKQGPAVATRLVFTFRQTGKRNDVHEVILTGEPGAFTVAQNEVQALLDAVTFK